MIWWLKGAEGVVAECPSSKEGVAVELKWNSRFKIGGLKSMIREEIF